MAEPYQAMAVSTNADPKKAGPDELSEELLRVWDYFQEEFEGGGATEATILFQAWLALKLEGMRRAQAGCPSSYPQTAVTVTPSPSGLRLENAW